VIVENDRLVAAACVMPLSASGILARSPERQMGLRHRAALGISEASDADRGSGCLEETGSISIAHAGRMIRRLDPERLQNILSAFYRNERASHNNFWQRHFPYLFRQSRSPSPMSKSMLKWIIRNLGSFGLAFTLALTVWILAVIAADPDETRLYPRAIPLEVTGQDPRLIITGSLPRQVNLTLRAPQSVWARLLAKNPKSAL
jgi:hypothetical protein